MDKVQAICGQSSGGGICPKMSEKPVFRRFRCVNAIFKTSDSRADKCGQISGQMQHDLPALGSDLKVPSGQT